MSINISVHGSPINIRRKKLFISDIETLKRSEINRRRRMRLEQVRQQSKDIANDIRQRVRGEAVKHLNGFEKNQRAEQEKQRSQKLRDLQQQYQDCLEEVGMGHLQASLEPNPEVILEAERERNRALAEERGRDAAAKLRQDLADTEEKKSVARNQQKFARTLEDLRSAVIVSLRKKSPKRTPKKKRIKKRKPLSELSDNMPPTDPSVSHVVPPPPPKAWTLTFDKDEHMHYDIVDEDVTNTQQVTSTATTSSSSSSSSAVLAAGDIFAPSTSRTTPAFQDEMEDVSDSDYTDNRETTGQVPAGLESSSSSPCSSTRKSSVKTQPSKVRFYDHTSKHECEYDHCALVERVVPNASEADAAQAAEVESQSCGAVPGPPPYECTYARGQRALARERLHRDYKQLLGDLHNLAREERLIKCTKDFCLPPEVFYEDYRRKEMDDRRQRNMDSAFEKIYHGTLTDTSMSPPGTCGMQDMHPHWQPAALDSPATLNVADYQRLSPAPTLNVGTAAAQSSATTATERNVYAPQNTEAMSSQPTIADSGIRHSHQVQDPYTNRLPSEVDVAGTSDQIYPGVVPPPVSESLDELMQKVNAQQAKLMEEIKMDSETPDTLRHIPELASSIGRPMEEMPHASDPQKRSLESPQNGEVQELSKGSDCPNYSVGTKSSNFCEMMKRSVKKNGTMKSIKMTKSLSTCVCKKRGKGKKEVKKSTKDNPVRLADDNTLHQSDGQVEEVLSEYSYEHSIVESSVESSVSGSTSYEGMKVVVSVSSEFTQERYHPGHSPTSKKTISISATPQKFQRCHHNCKKKCKHRHYKMPGLEKGLDVDKESEDKTSRKQSEKSPDSQQAESEKGLHIKKAKSPNKRRHKTPEKLPTEPEKEAYVEHDIKERSSSKQRKQERSTRVVKEKATMTSGLPQDMEANAENINSELEDTKTNGERKWQQVFEKSMSSGRDTTQSTSYMSPPEELISSNIKYLSTLLSAIKDSQKRKDHRGKEIDPKLVHYISRLLSMSRESIENLGVSSSDVSTPDIESSSLGSSSRMDESRTNRRVQTTLHPDESSNAMDALLHSVKQKSNILSQKSTCTAPCTRRIPGTSTPEENETYEVETPPFSSRVADMTLDEYKAQKFPELFSDYSERCTRRISSLSRKIEEIRDEQRKLMNSLSGNSSSSSGKEGLDSTKYMSPPESSTVMTQVKRKDNVRPLESVKLRSPTSSARVTRAGKENMPSQTSGHRGSYLHHIKDRLGDSVPPQLARQGSGSAESLYSTPPESDTAVENGNEQANGITTASQSAVQKDSSQSQYYTPVASCTDGLNFFANENGTGLQTQQDPGPVTEVNQTVQSSAAQGRDVCGPCAPNCNKNNCFSGRSISKETRQHTRPPSTLLRHNVQSIAEDRQIKELSTIIEGDTTFASPGSNRERRQSADHTSSSVSDDSVPDVLSEMYRRGLITSPLNLPEIGENSSMTTSSSPSSNEALLLSPKNLRNNDVNMNTDQQVGFLTYIGNKSEEISQMLVKFKNLFKGDSFSFKVIEVFSVLGKNLSPFEVELGLMLLGLAWDSNDKNLEVHPYFSSLKFDVTSENFWKQVLEAFKGLNEDSSLQELEAAFCKIGIVCPGGVLRRINTTKLSDVTSSSGSTELSTSTGSVLLPQVPTLLSISTEDLSTTEDEKNAS